jgi:hypothetical protein
MSHLFPDVESEPEVSELLGWDLPGRKKKAHRSLPLHAELARLEMQKGQ